MITLPAWAEEIFRHWGPVPAFGATEIDPKAAAKYDAITQRFRRRWRAELQADVWDLFGDEHLPQARHLLGVMVDLARDGGPGKRAALGEVAQIEIDIRKLAETLRQKIRRRDDLMRAHVIDGGINDDAAAAMSDAAFDLIMQKHYEPELHLVVPWFSEAGVSRKATSDALNAMLLLLARVEPMLLAPVVLTDQARAAIVNVTYDVDIADLYGPNDIKTARAALRRK